MILVVIMAQSCLIILVAYKKLDILAKKLIKPTFLVGMIIKEVKKSNKNILYKVQWIDNNLKNFLVGTASAFSAIEPA